MNKYFVLLLDRLKGAFPTVLFYIIQFIAVGTLFGQRYILVAACSTGMFQIRRKQYNHILDYIQILVIPLILCLPAYFATRNIILCILLNIAVPVCLVFWKTSQFTPKGYLGFAMTFVFLELRPFEPEELPVLLAVTLFCFSLLIPALILHHILYDRAVKPTAQIEDSLLQLSGLLEQLSKERGASVTARKQLYDIAQSLHHLGYSRQRLFHIPSREQRFCHLFALLFQRAYYLVSDEKAWENARKTYGFSRVMSDLSELVDELYHAQEGKRLADLTERIQQRLERTRLPQGRLRIFYRSVLHTLLLLCREPLYSGQYPCFSLPTRQQFVDSIKRHLSAESFEFCFAIRLSVVLVISCTVNVLWDFEHTYWFPLHAFLLLQPSYEESAHRMLTRPIGTVIACLLVHIVYPYLPGLNGIFIFSLAMIALMYCCTPGTWVHPVFSTSFALTMATLTMGEAEAIGLRIFYLAIALILVCVVNRFLLPVRSESQFIRNIRSLFYLQASYWYVIGQNLRETIDPALFSEMLAQFYMVYQEVVCYIDRLSPAEKINYDIMQLTLWNMFSELEQIECLVQVGALSEPERASLGRLVDQLAPRLSPPRQELTVLKADTIPCGDLQHMIKRYLENAGILMRILPPIAKKYHWTI